MTDTSPSSSPSIPTTPTSYVKLIRKDRTHNGLVLKEGYNCLKKTETFDERPECGPGGLYFCKEEDVGYWLFMYGEHLGYIATVTLCPESMCVAMDDSHKLKADRLLLGPFQPIEEFFTPERALRAVQIKDNALQYIPHKLKTMSFCLAAVRQNGCAIQFVPEEFKTGDMYLAAVRQNGCAIQFVPEEFKTFDLCLAAVQQDGAALFYIPQKLRTFDICLAAVQQKGRVIQYVPEECKTLFLYFVAGHQNANVRIPKELVTFDNCLAAVQQDACMIQYVPEEFRTISLCATAVQKDARLIQYVPVRVKVEWWNANLSWIGVVGMIGVGVVGVGIVWSRNRIWCGGRI